MSTTECETGKRGWPSKSGARAGIPARQQDRMTAYLCDHCHCWHLTGHRDKSTAERAQIHHGRVTGRRRG